MLTRRQLELIATAGFTVSWARAITQGFIDGTFVDIYKVEHDEPQIKVTEEPWEQGVMW